MDLCKRGVKTILVKKEGTQIDPEGGGKQSCKG